MASEMIERVARAIFATGDDIPEADFVYHSFEDSRTSWEALARAAIAAMREPTEEQYDALCATDKMWRELTSRIVWQTYIDAALGGSEDLPTLPYVGLYEDAWREMIERARSALDEA